MHFLNGMTKCTLTYMNLIGICTNNCIGMDSQVRVYFVYRIVQLMTNLLTATSVIVAGMIFQLLDTYGVSFVLCTIIGILMTYLVDAASI